MAMTLGVYFARRFVTAVAVVFATCFFLVGIADFLETLRRAGDAPGTSPGQVALLTLHRVPQLMEQILPFAILFGAMGTYLGLSRKLELVVARAAGVSAWQFVAPALVVALLIGIAATTAYNPISTALREQADRIEAELLAKGESRNRTGQALWIRQRSVDGQAIINAQRAADQGLQLSGVTVFTFDQQGRFVDRIEAKTAHHGGDSWILREARLFASGVPPQDFDTYHLATSLTSEQVRESLAAPASVSFWQLPAFIELAERAGLAAQRYKLQYQALIARPLLLVAMVLVAASVSLRFARQGGTAKMVLLGVVAGFVLYVLTELAEDLGAAGILDPTAAAWGPVLLGMLVGVVALLNLEDG